MAHWSVSRLIAYLDENFPDWRQDHADPYDAAEFYGVYVTDDMQINHYGELDFNEPNYGNLADGFDDSDNDS